MQSLKPLRIGFYCVIKTITTWDFGTQSNLKNFNNKLCMMISNASHCRFPNCSCKQYQLFNLDGSYFYGHPMCGHHMQHCRHDNRTRTNNSFETLTAQPLPSCPIAFKYFTNNMSNQVPPALHHHIL